MTMLILVNDNEFDSDDDDDLYDYFIWTWYIFKALYVKRVIVFCFFLFQANVILKEKETFIEYLQKQLNETKSKLDSEVRIASMSTLPDYPGLSKIQRGFLVFCMGYQVSQT